MSYNKQRRGYNRNNNYRYDNNYHHNEYSNITNPYIGNASTDDVLEEIRRFKLAETNSNQSTNPYLDENLIKGFNQFSPRNNKEFINSHKVEKPYNNNNNNNDDDDNKYNSANDNNSNHDNYGWKKGWSLEQEFNKQSFLIDVAPENVKYLRKREISDSYPRERYRRRRGEMKKHIIHWGQRKLLLSEIEFLNHYIKHCRPGDDGKKLVLYIGAASGKHIPLLLQLYDEIIMDLWDPNDFCSAVKQCERIKIYQQYFTDDEAEKYGNLGRDILFISDIRTADAKRQDSIQCEESVIMDNKLQSKWCKLIACNGHLVAAVLKYRLPYPHLIGDDKCKQLMLDGTIKMQCWAPVTSTETRLEIKPDINGNIKERYYDCKQYEEQLFWFNVKARQSFVDNHKYYTPQIGIINSYDSWAECLILEQYMTYYKGKKYVDKQDVIDLVNKITKFINNKRCLLTKPGTPQQQKQGLGLTNHSRFHYNQQIGNPSNNTNNNIYNIHGLIGYEGILFIDPEEREKEYNYILNIFHKNGIDIKGGIDKMLDIKYGNILNKYGWTVIPCYNRPIYNIISIGNNQIYLIPLNGFSDLSFKISGQYSSFYTKCFGKFANCCCLTGFLMDNHGMEKDNKLSPRFELNIIDILSPNLNESNYDHNKRKQFGTKYIVNNYEKYKHTVIESDFFKYIPMKLMQCPSKTGGERNIQSFKNKILKKKDKNIIDRVTHKKMNEDENLKWNDIHFDIKQYHYPQNGYYFNKIALNSRIGGILWIKNENENVLLSQLKFSNL